MPFKSYVERMSGKKILAKGINTADGEPIEVKGKFLQFGTEIARPAGTASYTVAVCISDEGDVFTVLPGLFKFVD